ncbi:MAG: hypothetical protein HY716_03565 [Planctomycetes bacterium]|nr:hypothetical protein [Planctomycetota bacterium]
MVIRFLILLAAGGLLPATQEGKLDEWRNVRKERSQKSMEAEALEKAAHEALDQGDYDSAVETHKKARALRAESEALGKALSRLLPEVLRGILRDLKERSPEVRHRAAAALLELGPAAIPAVESLLKAGDLDPDIQARIRKVVQQIGNVEIDANGKWGQWAVDAEASSQYGEDGWSAQQACGKPDTPQAGDQQSAWASANPDDGDEWLELTYELSVRPTRIRIHETFNPGAVVKIEARDAEKKWHVLWKGKDKTAECPGCLDIRFDAPKVITRVIRITLDTSSVQGWNEIDAVQLFGELADTPASK